MNRLAAMLALLPAIAFGQTAADFYCGFENGNDDDALTTNILNSATDSSLGVWTINGSGMTIETGLGDFDMARVVAVAPNAYDDGGSTRLFACPAANEDVYVNYELDTDVDDIAVGMWFRYGGAADPGFIWHDIVFIGRYLIGFAVVSLVDNPTPYLQMHTSNGTGEHVEIAKDTLYWLAIRSDNTAGYLSVYDSAYSLIGTSYLAHANGNDNSFIRLGRTDATHGTATNNFLYYDDLIISTDGTDHPLLPSAMADTVTASSVSFEDVFAAYATANTGGVVNIPSGTANWSSDLSVAKPVSILGAGIDSTIITNTQNSVTAESFSLTGQAGGMIRLSGMTIDGNQQSEAIDVSNGSATNYAVFVIDSIKMVDCITRALNVSGFFAGLVYSNTFLDCNRAAGTYMNTSPTFNTSWSSPYTIGTTNAVVYEDNMISYSSGSWLSSIAGVTHGLGARSAWRYNTFTNADVGLDLFPLADFHGNQEIVTSTTETSEPPGGGGTHRATRQAEFYKNTAYSDVGGGSDWRLTDFRGGTVLVWSNTYVGADMDTSFYMREEDGQYDQNFKTNYPGFDQHRLWIWSNTVEGALVATQVFANAEDAVFIGEGTNLFWRAPESGDPWGVYPYTPLEYPHPLRESLDGGAGGGDGTAPELTSVVIGADGVTVVAGHDEAVTIGAGGSGGASLTGTWSGSVGLTYSSGSGTTGLTFAAASAVGDAIQETVTFSYTQPGDGIEDAAGNDLATVSGEATVNGSAQRTGPDRPPGRAFVQKP